MLNPDPQPICGVLYVDDEEKALKYFRMAFAPKFEIFTASSAAAGLEILERESGKIGIVLSDQRMPTTLGAEFLGTVRERCPEIVRILTTAYSDLGSAISAVNQGHIYQYVVKPWEIDDLGMVLQRAADYFRVLSERNALLSVKMTTLQRILSGDRVKWLLLHAESLDGKRRAALVRGLVALIRALPDTLHPRTVTADPAARRFEIDALIRAEYANAVRSLSGLKGAPGPALPEDLAANLPDAPDALRALVAALRATPGVGAGDLTVATTGSRFDLAIGTSRGLDVGDFNARLFGLLTERDTSPLGIALLNALVALADTGGSLRIAVGVNVFEFAPAAETDSAPEAIDALYEKFMAADISSL